MNQPSLMGCAAKRRAERVRNGANIATKHDKALAKRVRDVVGTLYTLVVSRRLGTPLTTRVGNTRHGEVEARGTVGMVIGFSFLNSSITVELNIA